MGTLEAIVLGLVQGLTEFLPVSSSGHLVIGSTLLGVIQEGVLFEVAVHAGTLLAVLIVYRARVASLVGGAVRGDADAWRYGLKLGVATLPAVALVLLAGDAVEAAFDSPTVAGVALLVTGSLLLTTRFTAPRATALEPSWIAALAIGCAQAFALVPGISRSGSTVVMALALGVAPVAAAEFSFMMSIAAVTGAVITQLPEAAEASSDLAGAMALGGFVAMLSGVAAIWLFLKLLRAQRFHHFAYYCFAAGAAFLLYLHA